MATLVKKYDLPTGKLLVGEYSRGKLETLSIGDYGKQHNVKADFLGYTRELDGVKNRPCMPLSEKWVITLSTQYGCPMKCTFCDVPKIPFRGNASFQDLAEQLKIAIRAYPEVHYTDRLNVHFARMGEPIFNPAVFDLARRMMTQKRAIQDVWGLRAEVIHPVLTTSAPLACNDLLERLTQWCEIKNDLYHGQAGLQLSINSTDEHQRMEMFQNKQRSLLELAKIAEDLPAPLGRKYCLNFALATGYTVDASYLASLFDPAMWMVKITPIHNNNACRANTIETIDGYRGYHPYRQAEGALKDAGFDVLVFVPSMDEEQGMITCGNAVLSGTEPTVGC